MQSLKVDLLVRGQLVRTFTFAASTITVGRDPRSRLYIDNPSVSREHARFVLTPGGCVLEDGGSANGTFVNGQQVARALVSENDQIQIGKFTLVARVIDGA
ncbi:MAG: FHA domain-containing protein, partial [Deltaproteobacteria bacterium]|nr:FHA domain-containing protein [Deltaproteobacteria bacterium]